MKLIAMKPCGFGGKKFYIGDEIPAEDVLDPKTQEKMGVLVIVPDDTDVAAEQPAAVQANPVDTMEVLIRADEGDMPLDLTQEGLQAVVDVLTDKASAAEKVISKMTDGDALILLHLTDSRKAVKELAEARAKALNTEESAGEQ